MHARASAILHPDDRFNKQVGQRLAISRAIEKCFPHLDASLRQLHKTTSRMKGLAYRTVGRQQKKVDLAELVEQVARERRLFGGNPHAR